MERSDLKEQSIKKRGMLWVKVKLVVVKKWM
jgi:hypothetical protein